MHPCSRAVYRATESDYVIRIARGDNVMVTKKSEAAGSDSLLHYSEDIPKMRKTRSMRKTVPPAIST